MGIKIPALATFFRFTPRIFQSMSSSFKYKELDEGTDLLDLVEPAKNSSSFGAAASAAGPNFIPASASIPMGAMGTSGQPASGNQSQAFRAVPDESALGPISAVVPAFLRNAAHPYVCLFHIAFKGLAVFTYWIIYMFTKDIVFTFILTTIFLALDFWTVKNVTGRILVGLRWWNKVNDDGTSEWVFESGSDRSQVSSLDKNVFWIALYVFPIYWAIAAISNFLSFSPNFVILNLMGIAFAGTNAMGYTKCSRSGQQAVSQWATTQAMRVFTSGVIPSSSTNV